MYSDGVMRHFTLSVLYDVPCVANAVNNSHIVMNALGWMNIFSIFNDCLVNVALLLAPRAIVDAPLS